MSQTTLLDVKSLAKKRILAFAPSGLLAAVMALLGGTAGAEQKSATPARTLIQSATSWSYQLQKLDSAAAARTAGDVLVTDYSFDGTAAHVLGPEDVAALRKQPNGNRRLVIAYLSIGEAEAYRYYWDTDWTKAQEPITSPRVAPAYIEAEVTAPIPSRAASGIATNRCVSEAAAEQSGQPPRPSAQIPDPAAAPAWLHYENVQWRSNYNVRFWDAGWQQIIFGEAEAYLDRIIAAGFDGIYLDRADAYSYWLDERESAEQDMVDFITKLTAYARTKNPDFVVILQNAEELAEHPEIVTTIDAIAKEDLYYGSDHTEQENCPEEIATSLRHLKHAQASGLSIFVVEYLSDPKKMNDAIRRIAASSFVPLLAPRQLDALSQ